MAYPVAHANQGAVPLGVNINSTCTSLKPGEEGHPRHDSDVDGDALGNHVMLAVIPLTKGAWGSCHGKEWVTVEMMGLYDI